MQLTDWVTTPMQQDIWKNKYQHNDETFEEWLDRVSGGSEILKELIRNKRFLFAGRILANRGLNVEGRKVTYSNCYVLPQPQDNLESIFDTAKQLARTFSYGGGVGIDISKLRPKGAEVNNSAKETTGAVSFMELYSLVTALIGQNGRRGALMLSLDVSHPDIEDFIDIKKDLTKVTKANISIKVNAEFMEAVEKNQMYICKFEVEDTGEMIHRSVNARELFMKLAENNWDYAEPGILFWDNIENYNLMSEYEDFKYAGVNPCAEEPLPEGGSCNLGAINLSEYVLHPFMQGMAKFDMVTFERDIHLCITALNDVLIEGMELHPLEIQRKTVKELRQIGLGVMGIADMLIKMGLTYGSKEANWVMTNIAQKLFNTSIMASGKYRVERELRLKASVPSFLGFEPEKIINCNMKNEFTEEAIKSIKENGMFNSQILTIAPTGSISTMLGVSGGIEPHFALSYTRKTESLHKEGDVYYEVEAPIVEMYRTFTGDNSETLPDYFVTSHNLDPYKRIGVQSVWQKRIDASISSTINLKEETTAMEVFNIYLHAHKMGLKGLTVYRDNCQRGAILTTEKPKEKVEGTAVQDLVRGQWKPIAEDTVYYRRKVKIGCGKLNLFIGYSDSESTIQDLYIEKSGQGGCEKNLKTTVIAMSGILRLGGNLAQIEKAFSGISTCASFVSARKDGKDISKGNACGSAIIFTIKDFLLGNEKRILLTYNKETHLNMPETSIAPIFKVPNNLLKCPECDQPVAMVEGCMTCLSCGYSKCN